jgi:ribonuclease HI
MSPLANPSRPPVRNPAQWITVFSDASYCPRTRAYGWCFWIKHGHPATTLLVSGGGQGLANSEAAEVEALRQGLKQVRQLEFADKRIVVQSDCVGALRKIEADLDALCAAGAQMAYSKHVKGHQGYGTPRSSVNSQCDRKAGEEMRKVRDGLQKEQSTRLAARPKRSP